MGSLNYTLEGMVIGFGRIASASLLLLACASLIESLKHADFNGHDKNKPWFKLLSFVGKRSNNYAKDDYQCLHNKLNLMHLYKIVEDEIKEYENCLVYQDIP